uniref:Terpene cyclase/mutase family member n=1 Tax=Pseudo-nitzschia multistriata TaxID=183589 RepID=A0A448YVA5_9STRA
MGGIDISAFADCSVAVNHNFGIPLSVVVFLYAVVAVYTTLVLGTPRNLKELGLRPHGENLWGWWWSYNINARNGPSGISGYDPILGSFDPSSRTAFHVAAVLALWASVLRAGVFFGGDDQGELSVCKTFYDDAVPSAFLALGVYAFAIGFAVHYFLPGVSKPGGPRPHKIPRSPKWKDGRTSIPEAQLKGWTFLTAQKSHLATSEQFGSETLLTGEPAGRQTWFNVQQGTEESKSEKGQEKASGGGVGGFISSLLSPTKNSKTNEGTNDVDEALVQELALGGRPHPGFEPSVNPNTNDQIFRAQQIRNYLRDYEKKTKLAKSGDSNEILPSPPPDMSSSPTTIEECCRKAVQFYNMLVCEDGHWAADYGGPHFLLPGLIVTWYVMNRPSKLIDEKQAQMMAHYIRVHQQLDGGWGSHIESPSTMFGSVLMYVALRLLGADKDDEACVKARSFMDEHGGALYTSSWSKFYLCLLGVMDWKGHNSVPPEMWMLPNWIPFHPGRMWCHARMVYLPMGYLYGSRFVYAKVDSDPLIAELRTELYPGKSYDSIPWIKTRHLIAVTDNYSPIPLVMRLLQNALARYENWSLFDGFRNFFRARGLEFSMEYMKAEDLQTNFIDIGPVNKVLNMLSMYHHSVTKPDGSGDAELLVEKHMARVRDYLWVAEDGMKMQGYNGSQCWDTSFAIQAMWEAGLLDEFPELTRKVWGYFERTQILSTEVSQSSPAYEFETCENRNKFYRHISEGGWPFSTSAHGWPISDCTGEGLKATLCLLKSKTIQDALNEKGDNGDGVASISDERLYKAAHILLTYQNEDGGWATYENNRGWGWYEQLNPSEVFGDIMIDYSYVECSMASLTALADFAEHFPDHRADDIRRSIDKGRSFLKSIQRDDGSWYGSWACCFCYGIWFGIEGLVRCGEPTDSSCIVRACRYLLKQQNPNGGWGEDFTSCYDKDYAKEGMKAYGDSEGSGVVNTAWALMALSCAKCDDVEAIRRGVRYLMKRELPSGDWPQEGISGVFNRSIGITYTAYRNVFPIWALGRCREAYGEEALSATTNGDETKETS